MSFHFSAFPTERPDGEKVVGHMEITPSPEMRAAVVGAMGPERAPKDGERAMLVWYGGQSPPVVGSWLESARRWVHSGTCRNAPDMAIPIQQAIAAPEMLGALRRMVPVCERMSNTLVCNVKISTADQDEYLYVQKLARDAIERATP